MDGDVVAAAAVVEDLDRHSLGGGGNAGAEGAFHAAVHGGDNDALAGDAEPLPDRIGSDVGDVPFGASTSGRSASLAGRGR